jgi:hypothetical protein
MTKSSDINQIPYPRQEFPKTLKNNGDMSGFLVSHFLFDQANINPPQSLVAVDSHLHLAP